MMTINQLFFAVAALILGLAGFIKYYLDAKIGPMREQIKDLAKLIDWATSTKHD